MKWFRLLEQYSVSLCFCQAQHNGGKICLVTNVNDRTYRRLKRRLMKLKLPSVVYILHVQNCAVGVASDCRGGCRTSTVSAGATTLAF
jgi:hypothetical protein